MGLREDIVNYRQMDGLVSPNINPTPDSTGNGLLYTSLYFILLTRRKELQTGDYADFYITVDKCQVPGFKGLFYRSTTKTKEQEAWDDYVGLSYASVVMGSGDADNILFYGHSHKFFSLNYIYNDLAPGKFSMDAWFGRNPAITAHFSHCAQVKVGVFKNIISSIVLWFQRESILGWIMENAKGRQGTPNIKSYIEKELGASHPIARYWV